jgi:hypothetical protein
MFVFNVVLLYTTIHTMYRDAALLNTTLQSSVRIAPQGILPPNELPIWANDAIAYGSNSSSNGQLVCITGRTVSCSITLYTQDI